MTMYEGSSDLHKRVERYEAALDEMRAAQQEIKNILHDQVLYDRWQQLGADLGFVVAATAATAHPQSADMNGHSVPALTESWAG
ncbi:hypothetical protein ACIA5C_16075 [Actinoplanes sp. NPDC051343]|jgi:hypothetical protein|uniref:hypothetical protein n=1 Tax=Actinoplanes sp. NPDC051343 TaxID=3363906 RepID=UPI003795BA97